MIKVTLFFLVLFLFGIAGCANQPTIVHREQLQLDIPPFLLKAPPQLILLPEENHQK
jgi:hypothetical protein